MRIILNMLETPIKSKIKLFSNSVFIFFHTLSLHFNTIQWQKEK